MKQRSRKLRFESLESRRLMAVVNESATGGDFERKFATDPAELTRSPSVLHNAALPGDVDGNGVVNPLDALIVLNACTPKRGTLPSGIPPQASKPVYLDVNRDGGVTVRDALSVLNRIREEMMPPPAIPAEGENVLGVQVDSMRSNRLGELSATVHRTVKPTELTAVKPTEFTAVRPTESAMVALIESRVESRKRPTVATKTDLMLGVSLSESRVEAAIGSKPRSADRG